MCTDKCGGDRPLRSSDQRLQGEDMGTQQGRWSLIKSLTCQIVSDLAKIDQGDFNHDIDCIDTARRRDCRVMPHYFKKVKKK